MIHEQVILISSSHAGVFKERAELHEIKAQKAKNNSSTQLQNSAGVLAQLFEQIILKENQSLGPKSELIDIHQPFQAAMAAKWKSDPFYALVIDERTALHTMEEGKTKILIN